jgi:HTH-type transcriptional regulator/antitoxin HigA
MSAVASESSLYKELLAKKAPHVIRTEEQNQEYIAELEALLARSNLTPGEQEYADLLTVLIEKFEERYQIDPAATPVDVLRHLMDAHNLKQADMAGVFGSKSVVSDVLKGKRSLSKTHIQRLADKFHISPALFFR